MVTIKLGSGSKELKLRGDEFGPTSGCWSRSTSSGDWTDKPKPEWGLLSFHPPALREGL
jgi:hypothetical protein